MKQFMDKDFLLDTETSQTLYHDFAKTMPIFDFHNHLNPKDIYEDVKYENISQIWLSGDHYKWRLMRANGITEDFITGNKSDEEKFIAYAKTMPYALGNPLYHWTHLELQRYFQIDTPLSEKTATEIYHQCNEILQKKEFSVRGLIQQSNVTVMCTTDDPKDDLSFHKLLKKEGYSCNVLPSFRPDSLIHMEKEGFLPYVTSLNLKNLEDVLCFLVQKLDYFHEVGCRLSDHGLDTVMYLEATEKEVDTIYKKALAKEPLSHDELRKYKGFILSFLGKEYHKRAWAMQYHIGPMRNNSSRMFTKIGADTGFDSINDGPCAVDLSRLLDSMDQSDQLPKTILYCLNPADNAVLASMLGNFQGGGILGKMQFGSGWWFMDTKEGMNRQMDDLASMGMLSRFVGMLTDSRSFLSFPRHEYFRRILCNKIGHLVENGEYPADIVVLGQMVQDISYNNIKNYIALDERSSV
ncbi:MAG: glucuronate isomerase [Eubacteriales bacterium]